MNTDWKTFLAVAGGSFFANLVALIAVVAVMLAPVKVDVTNNAKRIEANERAVMKATDRLSDHSASIGHEGMQEIIKRIEVRMGSIESNVEWIRQRMETP